MGPHWGRVEGEENLPDLLATLLWMHPRCIIPGCPVVPARSLASLGTSRGHSHPAATPSLPTDTPRLPAGMGTPSLVAQPPARWDHTGWGAGWCSRLLFSSGHPVLLCLPGLQEVAFLPHKPGGSLAGVRGCSYWRELGRRGLVELGEALGGSAQSSLLGLRQLASFTKSLIYSSWSSPVLGIPGGNWIYISLISSLWAISRRSELQMELLPWQGISEVLSVVSLMANKGWAIATLFS